MNVLILSNWAGSLMNVRTAMLRAMLDAGHSITACAPEDNEEVRAHFAAMGVTYESVSIQRFGLNPVADTRSVFDLVRLFRGKRPDRLFSYTIKPIIYGSLAARLAGIRREHVFSMVTGLGYAFTAKSATRRALSLPVRRLYRAALAYNRTVFFHNPDDRDLFRALGLLQPPTRAVVLNGSGVDLTDYPEHPPVIRPIVFLLISRLLKGKGIEEFVAAASVMKRRHPSVRFRIVGPEDSNPEAIDPETLRAWRAAGVVEFAGGVRDVRPELSRASVFVLPSHREGTPRAVLEAMSMGRPIITADAPGCRETVQPGRNGFLVPVADALALEQAMQHFIDDPALIAAMGRCSRVIAVEKYDVRKVNDLLLREMGLN